LVRGKGARRQEMDKVVAVSTWPAGLFAAGVARAFPRRVAVQPDRGNFPAHPPVPSVALAQDGAHGSAAGLTALRRTSADARAPGTFAARVTNAIRIRRCGGRAATRSGGPGVYATLCVCALRRSALRYDSPPATPRPGSLCAARSFTRISTRQTSAQHPSAPLGTRTAPIRTRYGRPHVTLQNC